MTFGKGIFMGYLYHLTVEQLLKPIGIDVTNPRFGWRIFAQGEDVVQKSFRIRLFDEKGLVWDSDVVNMGMTAIRYPAHPLKPMTNYR